MKKTNVRKRTNWKNLGEQEIRLRYGFTERQAHLAFENAYRRALRQVRKTTKGATNINIQRETYFSINARGTQLFDAYVDGTKVKINLKDEYKKDDLEESFTLARFDKFRKKYDKKNDLFGKYERGEISYKKLEKEVEKIRKSADYLKEYNNK